MRTAARRMVVLLIGAILASSTPAFAQEEASDSGAGAGATLLSLSEDGGQPVAGRYADSALGIELEFTLGDDWVYGSSADGFGIDLMPDGEGEPLFTISEVNRAVLERPCETEGDDTYWEDTADIELSPQAVIDHIACNPYIRTEGPVPIAVDGIEGLQLDVTVEVGRRCIHPDIPLWSSFYGEGVTDYYTYTLADAMDARIIAFEAGGKTVLIVMEALGDAHDRLLEIGSPIVASLTVGSAVEPGG